MIKKTIAIFFALLFLIIKKIFVRENRTPHKIMDSVANKLHSLFLFSSFGVVYLSWFDIEISSYSFNTYLYILLFLQMVIITRYFNPQMLIVKELQSKIVRKINKFSLIVFIGNWIVFSFGFAFFFLVILLLNNGIYLFIINQIKKQKEQEEFKKQFGEGSYSQGDIVQKHILNLFESKRTFNTLTKSEIKKQYRIMAKKYHPDVYKGDEKEKFTSINSSYNYLIDLVNKNN